MYGIRFFLLLYLAGVPLDIKTPKVFVIAGSLGWGWVSSCGHVPLLRTLDKALSWDQEGRGPRKQRKSRKTDNPLSSKRSSTIQNRDPGGPKPGREASSRPTCTLSGQLVSVDPRSMGPPVRPGSNWCHSLPRQRFPKPGNHHRTDNTFRRKWESFLQNKPLPTKGPSAESSQSPRRMAQ